MGWWVRGRGSNGVRLVGGDAVTAAASCRGRRGMRVRPALVIGLALILGMARGSRAETDQSKSEVVAVSLTIGGSIAPVALLATGFLERDVGQEVLMGLGALTAVPGPGMGHWYVRGSAKVGVIARLAASAIAVYGTIVIGDQALCSRVLRAGETAGLDACDGPSRGVGIALLATGLTVYAGSVAYDVVTVRREVRAHNLASSPTMSPIVSSRNGTIFVGVGLQY